MNKVQDSIVGIAGAGIIEVVPHLSTLSTQDYSQGATLIMQAIALIATIIKLFGKKSNVQSVN